MTLTLAFATNSIGIKGAEEKPNGEPRALDVNLPAGLVGEPGAVAKCTREEFDGEACPPSSEIGENHVSVSGAGLLVQYVYNLVPPPGVAAQFAFTVDGIGVFLDARVRSGGDYGITEHANVPQRKVVFNTTTIWGVPGEHETGAEHKPLLTLPTSCGQPPEFSIEELGTWQDESLRPPAISFPWHNSEDDPVGITGCDKLKHFEPSVNLAPDTSFSDTPAGLSATVRVPQGLNPEGLATPGLKETTVVLPEGVAINPGQATGLEACQPSEENIGGPESEKGNDGRSTVVSCGVKGRHRRNRDAAAAGTFERQRIRPAIQPTEPTVARRRRRRRHIFEADWDCAFE